MLAELHELSRKKRMRIGERSFKFPKTDMPDIVLVGDSMYYYTELRSQRVHWLCSTFGVQTVFFLFISK